MRRYEMYYSEQLGAQLLADESGELIFYDDAMERIAELERELDLEKRCHAQREREYYEYKRLFTRAEDRIADLEEAIAELKAEDDR